MAVNTQTIRVDLNTGKIMPVAFAHQNDTNRQFTFQLYNNGVAFTPSSTTVKFAYKSPIVNGQYSVITGSQMASGTVSGNTVAVTLPAAYTQVSGVGLLTMILTTSGNTLRPVNIKFVCQGSADGDDTVLGASDFPATLGEIAEDWLEENISIQIDDTLSVSGKAADAKVTGDEISDLDGQIANLKSDLESIDTGLSSEAKTALLNCFANVAWINENGITYFQALSDALSAESGGSDDSEETSYTDVGAWYLNKTIVYPYQGDGYLEAMSDLDARMVTKTTTTLVPGSYYRATCDSPYEFYMIFCDSTDVCQSALPQSGRSQDLVFPCSGNNKMGVVVATPSTATVTDPQSASFTLAKEVKKTNLTWSYNVAIYTTRTGQAFNNIQAPVDARMLLTSFIPLESGKSYQFRCNSPYEIYVILLDSNDMYIKFEGYSNYGTNLVTFKNTRGATKASIAVKTPSTASSSDASAIEIYVV